MRIFIIAILISSLILGACKTSYDHLRIADKHIQKAIEKDPSIKVGEVDTVIVIEYDTIKGKDEKDSIIYITETITLDCPELDLSEVKSKTEIRQTEKTKRKNKKEEEKTERVVVKEEEKTERKNKKQEEKTERTSIRWGSLWFLWYFLGVATVIAIQRLKQLKP